MWWNHSHRKKFSCFSRDFFSLELLFFLLSLTLVFSKNSDLKIMRVPPRTSKFPIYSEISHLPRNILFAKFGFLFLFCLQLFPILIQRKYCNIFVIWIVIASRLTNQYFPTQPFPLKILNMFMGLTNNFLEHGLSPILISSEPFTRVHLPIRCGMQLTYMNLNYMLCNFNIFV